MEVSGDCVPWQLSGCFSAARARRRGAATSEFRVRFDCPPESLMADVSRAAVEGSRQRPAAGSSGGRTECVLEGGEVAAAVDADPVLLAQVGECQARCGRQSAALQLLSGRLLLRGETVLISGGVPHFSENSQLAPAAFAGGVASLARPPTLSGRPVRDLLDSVVAELGGGACLFYGCGGGGVADCLQLCSRQTLLRQPLLHLSGRQHKLESLARLSSASVRVRPANADDLQVPAAAAFARDPLGSAEAAAAAFAASGSSAPPRRTLLLMGGRCLFRGDSLLVLAGLLHFSGVWHRVLAAGSGAPPPPRIRGASILTRLLGRRSGAPTVCDAAESDEELDPDIEQAVLAAMDRPLLLSNVWLYMQGGTVFAGQTPMLSGAVLLMSPESPPVPLDQQDRMLAGLPPTSPRRLGVPRLFLQSGRFTLTGGGLLRATSGVAWLRAKKVRLGPLPSEQLTVAGALPFPPTAGLKDSARFEDRDLLFKDGMLFLDDLTPLLAGGRVSLGQQEMPLDWLSGIDEPPDSKGVDPHHEDEDDGSPEELELLTDGVCLLESDGSLHLLRGRLTLPGEVDAVLIDLGVAHFSPRSGLPTHDSVAGFAPPRLVGRPVTRPRDARAWAATVDTRLDRATFTSARLCLRRGTVWLNGQVPLLRGCRLLINGRWVSYCLAASDAAAAPASANAIPSVGGRAVDHRWMQSRGFSGSYSVFSNCQTEALVFRLKARFADCLQFLFGPENSPIDSR